MINPPRFLRVLLILLPCLFLVSVYNPARGEEIDAEYSELSPEELAWIEIPEVITPARIAQPITEAPSSVSIITADSTVSNKILVMIDGRSVYMDFYGTTLWSTLPVLLDEIKRIEVVRGPGSALYGANAFSGVINIITKTPEEQEDTLISASAGTKNTYQGSAITAGNLNDLGYKLALGWKEEGFWEDSDKKSLENLIANGSINYRIDEEKELRFGAGVNNGKDYISIEETQGLGKLDGYVTYLRTSYIQPNLKILSYWNRGDSDARSERTALKTSFLYNTYHSELQYALDNIPYNDLIVGGSYRYNTMDSGTLNRGVHQNISALFIQDDIHIAECLHLVAGGRCDHNSLINDYRIAPRGSLIFNLHPDHTIRLSVSKAYRDPTFLATNFDFSGTIDPRYPEYPTRSIGNPDLVPEKILSYEAGWSAFLTSFLKTRLDIFYNQIDDLIQGQIISQYPVFPFFPREVTFVNNGDPVRAIGGEVGAEFRITDWMNGFINYSYQELKNTRTDEIIKSAPKNKFNAGLDASLSPGLSATISSHYVDKTTWGGLLSGDQEIDDYILTNARLAYAIDKPDLELAVSAFNLFNDKHREHPLGEKIGQRILFTLSFHF